MHYQKSRGLVNKKVPLVAILAALVPGIWGLLVIGLYSIGLSIRLWMLGLYSCAIGVVVYASWSVCRARLRIWSKFLFSGADLAVVVFEVLLTIVVLGIIGAARNGMGGIQ